VFGIEGVAYQKAFKWFVKTEASRRGEYLNVVELKALGQGKKIHIRGLQPIMATGRLFVHPTQHILRDEMFSYPNGKHDDVIDALAMHQQVWRSIMSPEYWLKFKEAETRMIQLVRGEVDQRVKPQISDPGIEDFFGALWRDGSFKPNSFNEHVIS
jgi:hypothetical protein